MYRKLLILLIYTYNFFYFTWSTCLIDNHTTVKPKIINCSLGYLKDNNICIDCGIVPIEPNVRISGGIPAIPNSYPSHVLIIQNVVRYVNFSYEGIVIDGYFSETYQCSGTLINRYTILTAAHCTHLPPGVDQFNIDYTAYPTRASRFTVYLGLNDKSFVFDTSIPIPDSVVIANVVKIIDHPEFNFTNGENDISILIMDKSITFTKDISPACLPVEKSATFPGTNVDVFAAGWGKLNHNDLFTPNQLYNVKLKIYDSEKCNRVAVGWKKNWSQQICAGDITSNKDTCSGDSGGGLYYDTIIDYKVKRILTGIVSYGTICGNGIPSIYSRVSCYIDWIKENWKTGNEDIFSGNPPLK